MGLVVVKVGGSLAMYPQSLRTLCKKLASLSKIHKLVVVPGGGEFADTVRNVDKRFSLSSGAAHRMAILGMDQYGLLLADLTSEFVAISEIDEVPKVMESGKVPVFLPSKLLFNQDPLENSWDVTSDSIALYIAAKLHSEKLVLATDVDGIFTSDPRKDRSARLNQRVTPSELSMNSQRSSVDKALPTSLLMHKISCYVVNGLFPERIEAILDGQDSVYTLISDKLS
jgi:aspartokinase-like uncharacterized kinase